jgi:hypothetical protein
VSILPHIPEPYVPEKPNPVHQKIIEDQIEIWENILVLIEDKGYVKGREIIIDKRDFVFTMDQGYFSLFFKIRLGGNQEDSSLETLLSDLDSLGFQRFSEFEFSYKYFFKLVEPESFSHFSKVILYISIEESIGRDKIYEKEKIPVSIQFEVGKNYLSGWEDQRRVENLMINKFYSEIRKFFYTRICDIISS